jgi:hypothetical protein
MVRVRPCVSYIFGFVACHSAPARQPESRPLWPELSVAVMVIPTEARVGDTIRITAIARNERAEHVTLNFGNTCVLGADVFTRAGFPVTTHGCFEMETRVELEPHEEIVRHFTIPGPFWRDVRPGRYLVYGRLGTPRLVRYSQPVVAVAQIVSRLQHN